MKHEQIGNGMAAGSTGRLGYEFSASTKTKIAKRANYQCIVPGCKAVTIGPGAASDDVAGTGTACHIHSAGENGPRGRGGLLVTEIASVENGVWACATHGRLIDTNDGGAYPVSLIRSWKRLQEAQIKKARDNQATSTGWIDHISIANSFLFEPDAKLELGQFTILSGSHIGKTALCDWLAASLTGSLPDRWKEAPNPLLTSTKVYAPEEALVELDISGLGIQASLDGSPVIEVPHLTSTVHLQEDAAAKLSKLAHVEDDDSRIAEIFKIDRAAVRGLVRDIQKNGSSWGRGLGLFEEWKYEGEDENGDAVFSDVEKQIELRTQERVTLQGLSGSEAIRVLLEFSCALARQRAKHRPTIVILDASAWPLDTKNWEKVGTFLMGQPYQVLLTMNDRWAPSDPKSWQEWTWFRLERQLGGKTKINRKAWP